MADLLGPEPVTYERAKVLAQDENPAIRAALAGREDLPPEILYFLAEDKDADVRLAVARNTAAPRQTDLILAQDDDEEVRGGLAAKIAKVAPGLSPEESNKIRAQTYEALEVLAHDQITKVRSLLSEALKDAVDAPSDLVRLLAADLELSVSGPLLEYSPVLTDEDLIEIISRGPADGGVGAIARRDGVSEDLADAIIGTDDVHGIADLLGNHSAQIREEALDDLIERSREEELWQAPLVTRPRLPDGAVQRMAGFIAENLLDALRGRDDLDAATVQTVSEIVRGRLGGDTGGRKPLSAAFDFLKVDPPVQTVERLMRAGKLNDEVVFRALQAGDHAFVFASLIVRSGVTVSLARRIFVEKSAQGIVALMAKGNFPASMIAPMQQQMGRLAPSEVLQPDEGEMPLGEDEIDWQIEFYGDMTERA